MVRTPSQRTAAAVPASAPARYLERDVVAAVVSSAADGRALAAFGFRDRYTFYASGTPGPGGWPVHGSDDSILAAPPDAVAGPSPVQDHSEHGRQDRGDNCDQRDLPPGHAPDNNSDYARRTVALEQAAKRRRAVDVRWHMGQGPCSGWCFIHRNRAQSMRREAACRHRDLPRPPDGRPAAGESGGRAPCQPEHGVSTR